MSQAASVTTASVPTSAASSAASSNPSSVSEQHFTDMLAKIIGAQVQLSALSDTKETRQVPAARDAQQTDRMVMGAVRDVLRLLNDTAKKPLTIRLPSGEEMKIKGDLPITAGFKAAQKNGTVAGDLTAAGLPNQLAKAIQSAGRELEAERTECEIIGKDDARTIDQVRGTFRYRP